MASENQVVVIKLSKDEAAILNNICATFIMTTEGATSPDEVTMLNLAKELQKYLAQAIQQ